MDYFFLFNHITLNQYNEISSALKEKFQGREDVKIGPSLGEERSMDDVAFYVIFSRSISEDVGETQLPYAEIFK